ncbi:GNAT family N-acetyltransferase [Candidatus Woesearchaeota archaeon]|nr:GNAT family N-acetyltransferase [Candidatus Woesearchaeota archaeon]
MIRKARIEDIGEIAKLQKEYMRYHAAQDPYFAFKKNISKLWKDYAEQIIADPTQLMVVAEQDKRIVAYMTARIVEKAPIYQIDKVGQIGDAYVSLSYREQGIFTQLLEEIKKWFKSKKLKYIEHPISASNPLGLQVWKKKGFEKYMIWVKRKI